MSFFIKNATGLTRFQTLIRHVLTTKNATGTIPSATGLIFAAHNATGSNGGLHAMPVRTVPKNSRSLTGLVPNPRTQAMTAFESSLERDFLLLLDFDPDVELYEEQPLKITYHDEAGQRRTYTPDVLVRYRAERV